MREHVRKVCQIAPNEKNGDAGMELLYEYVIQRQAAFEKQQTCRLEKVLKGQEELKSALKALKHGVPDGNPMLVNQQVNGNNNQTTNVILNMWGCEDVKRISAAEILEILEEGGDTNVILGRILQLIYHKVPENRNAYLPNKKESMALVYAGLTPEDAQWVPRPRSELLPPMVVKSTDRVFDSQFEILASKATQAAKKRLDIMTRDLAKKCPIGGTPSKDLLDGVSSAQKAVLIANRPEK